MSRIEKNEMTYMRCPFPFLIFQGNDKRTSFQYRRAEGLLQITSLSLEDKGKDFVLPDTPKSLLQSCYSTTQ